MTRNEVFITDQDAEVTFNDTGGHDIFEEVIEVVVPDGVSYGIEEGQIIRLDLDDSTPADLPDDATVRVLVYPPTKEEPKQLGPERPLRQWNNADMYNENEVPKIISEQSFRLLTDYYLVIEVKSATAVSASDSWYEQQVIRWT